MNDDHLKKASYSPDDNTVKLLFLISFILLSCQKSSDEELGRIAGNPPVTITSVPDPSPAPIPEPTENEEDDQDEEEEPEAPVIPPSIYGSGGASLQLIGGCPQDVGAGSQAGAPFRVLALNSQSQPIASSSVLFSLSGGIGGSLSSSLVSTDENGVAEIFFQAGNSPGQAIVTASSLQGSVPCAFTVSDFTSYTIAINQSGLTNFQSAHVNALVSEKLRVYVTNGSVPVSGVQVKFEIQTGAGNFAGDDFILANTNNLGIAEASVSWRLGKEAGVQTVKASLNGDSSKNVTFTATATENWDLLISEISSSDVTLRSFGTGGTPNTTLVTLSLKDSNGAQLSNAFGQAVVFSTTLGTLIGSVSDNGDGTYSQLLRAPTGVGAATISATVNGDAITTSLPISIIHGPLSLAHSTFTTQVPSLPPNGIAQTTLSVDLRDSNGNLFLENSTVTIEKISGEGSVGGVTSNGFANYTAILTAPAIASNGLFRAQIGGDTLGEIEFVFANLAGVTINCTNGNYDTWANKDLYVTSGTLIIDNYNGITGSQTCPMTFRSLRVGVGGNVTTTNPTTDHVGGIDINITGDVIIDVGGKIDLDGKGYPGRTGNYQNGFTMGLDEVNGARTLGTADAVGFAGASHGGLGGGGVYATLRPNVIYGSADNPRFPGASGARNNTGTSGAGGGVIRITANQMTNNGQVLARGLANNGNSSAGAGGSIYLNSSKTISGIGTFSAKGGSAANSRIGGGGRIAFIGNDSSIQLSQIDVSSGPRGDVTHSATAGTFYRSLGAYVGSVTLTSDLSVNAIDDITTNVFGEQTDLTVVSGVTLFIDKATTFRNLTLEDYSVITHSHYWPVVNPNPKVELNIVETIEVETLAQINVVSKGYPSSMMFTNSFGCSLRFHNICMSGNGGSHYSKGQGAADGTTWGNPLDPNTYSGASSTENGSGIIRITSNTFDLKGIINANGFLESTGSHSAKTSAGGSVKIVSVNLEVGLDHLITARGGNITHAATSSAHSGAGGLIYVSYENLMGSLSTNIAEGTQAFGASYRGLPGVLTVVEQ